jgi:hypothetical protein
LHQLEDDEDPKGYVGNFGDALGGPRGGGFGGGGGSFGGGFGGGFGGFGGGGGNLVSRGGGLGMPAVPPVDAGAQVGGKKTERPLFCLNIYVFLFCFLIYGKGGETKCCKTTKATVETASICNFLKCVPSVPTRRATIVAFSSSSG